MCIRDRLGTDYFDIIHIHDIEYQNRRHTEWALTEGLDTVHQLKNEGRIGAVGFGIYPIDLWQRIFTDYKIGAGLVPVSYTHLDVYKRQLWEQPFLHPIFPPFIWWAWPRVAPKMVW